MRYENVIRFIALILILSLLLLAVIGCGNNNSTHNIQINNENHFIDIGTASLKQINDCLYYDINTNIVYWWHGTLEGGKYDVAPSPYYAPNGLPYRYNLTTNTFEEIK
jgi:ABC-type transport system involved in multi-copper enzyme maturation permease subunit